MYTHDKFPVLLLLRGSALQGVMGKVGFLWRDLKVETRDVDTGFESLKLTFVCGYNTNDLQVRSNHFALLIYLAVTDSFLLLLQPRKWPPGSRFCL